MFSGRFEAAEPPLRILLLETRIAAAVRNF
jgi:hypothetical protein